VPHSPAGPEGYSRAESGRWDVTIGIIAPLAVEEAAMATLITEPQPVWIEDDPNDYRIGYLESSEPGRPHRVALTTMPHDNTRNAAATCTDMLRTFPGIRCVLVTGIAGGVPWLNRPERHVRLGDVVVPVDGVIDYGHVRQRAGGAEPRRPLPGPSMELLRAVRRLQGRAFQGEPIQWPRWLASTRGQPMAPFARPPRTSDVLYVGEDVVEHPPTTLTGHLDGQPKVHYGKVGCADILLRDEHLRDDLAKQHGVLAFEMESAGVAASAAGHGVGWFMVRGVVDYCDGHKTDQWHAYGSLVAAGYLRGILAACRPFPVRRTAPRSGVIAVLTDHELDRIKGVLAEIPEPDLHAIWRAAMSDLVPLPESPPESLADLFMALTEVNADPDGVPPALALAEGAAAVCEQQLASRLHEAIDQVAESHQLNEPVARRRALVALRMQVHAAEARSAESVRPCVLIQIERDGIDHEACELTYWVQRRSNRWAPEPGKSRHTEFDRVELAMQDAIRHAEQVWRSAAEPVEIEFLLPTDLLHVEVEWWRVNLGTQESGPVCLYYPVVVRSLDRMRADHLHRGWAGRWRALWRHPARHRLYWGRIQASEGDTGLTTWGARLRADSDITTVALGSPPRSSAGREELEHALTAGVPVILWDRRVPLDGETVNRIEQLSRGSPREMTSRIHRLRRAGAIASSEEQKRHPGRHIALLWDDPERTVDGRPPP
jgi:nucleoside phosphorylase